MRRHIRGNIVMSIVVVRVESKIQDIVEKVNVFTVKDIVIKNPVLIGHSFTEKPGIIVVKPLNP